MQQRALRFVQQHRGPTLYSAQGDCTPATVPINYVGYIGSRRVTRTGHSGVELLVQRAFIYGIVDGVEVVFPVWRELVHTESTSSWQYFAAIHALFPMIRPLKLDGLIVHHYTFVRAGFTAISRLLEQHHNLFLKANNTDASRQYMASLLQLFVSTPCALHDVSGGIRWSSRDLLPKNKEGAKGFMRDLYSGIAAPRNSFDILTKGIPELLDMITWRGDFSHEDERRTLWEALDIADSEIVADLARLNPRVDRGRIVCNACSRMWPGAISRISDLYLLVWKFRKHTETRWGGVGPSLRCLVASLMMGTGVFIKALLARGAKRFFLGGFEKSSPKHLEYAIILSLSSTQAEKLLFELMSDDRPARRPDFYVDVLAEAMSDLMGCHWQSSSCLRQSQERTSPLGSWRRKFGRQQGRPPPTSTARSSPSFVRCLGCWLRAT